MKAGRRTLRISIAAIAVIGVLAVGVCAAKLIDPRLHTAVSLFEVLRRISVQRFELCTEPTWSCGERTFDGSLNVIQGCPVSKTIDNIFRQS